MKNILILLGLWTALFSFSQTTRFNGIYTNQNSFVKFSGDTLEFNLLRRGCDGWDCYRGMGTYSITDSLINIKTFPPNKIGYSRYYPKGKKQNSKELTITTYDDYGKLHDHVYIELIGQKSFKFYDRNYGALTINLSDVKNPEEIRIRGCQDNEYCHYKIPIRNINSDSIEVYLSKYSHFENSEIKFDYIMSQDSLFVRWSTKGYKPAPFPIKTKIKFAFWCVTHVWPWNYGNCELKRVSVHTNNYIELKKK